MTDNVGLIEDALATLEVHSYYCNTGSSLAGALDVVRHFVDRRGYRLQVVLLGDGELLSPEDYGAALEGREPGKYHRRTIPEQFRKQDWSKPDATIWW